MASDSEEIEYMALSSAPFNPLARQKTSDDSDEDNENEMFVHEEEGLLVHMSHDDNKCKIFVSSSSVLHVTHMFHEKLN